MARPIEANDDIRKRHVGSSQHKVVLFEREAMNVDGVSNVESFDEDEIVLETSCGIMVIKGHDLHIKQLNLNEGNVEIEGYVDSIEYMEDNLKKGRGLFARLLK